MGSNFYIPWLYRELGDKQLARQEFDKARSIDPSLALPWAGLSADVPTRESVTDKAYESCLRAVQIMLFQDTFHHRRYDNDEDESLIWYLGPSARLCSMHLTIQKKHNLNGLVLEAWLFYPSAIASFRLACCLMKISTCTIPRLGNALDAVQELEDLKREGLIDVEGLQIYAISLWQLGKNELALSTARDLAKLVSAMGE
ncbi:hypothetical protein Ancab_036863 [Ancistrocladus abbreviatus]